MARILSLISQKRACHVVTLEDPVEYVIPMEKALIHQREIGRDVADFPQGMRFPAIGRRRSGDFSRRIS